MPEDSNDAEPDNEMDYIDKILMKYKSHPSIIKIKENIIISNKFEFKDMTPDEIEKEKEQLGPKKACVENDLPSKILIGSNNIVSKYLSNI